MKNEKISKFSSFSRNDQLGKLKNDKSSDSLINGDALNNLNKPNSSQKSIPSVVIEKYKGSGPKNRTRNVPSDTLNELGNAMKETKKALCYSRTAQTSNDIHIKDNDKKNKEDRTKSVDHSIDDNYGLDVALGGDIISIRRKKKKETPSGTYRDYKFFIRSKELKKRA